MNLFSFQYTAFPSTVFFGENSFHEVFKLLAQYKKAFVIAANRQADYVKSLQDTLGADRIYHFNQVVQHVPADLIKAARQKQLDEQSDVLIGIGGGSAIGLAKALALESRHTIIAVPTTYAGSEMTNIWGITTPEGKTTGRDMAVLPKYVIYDPAMTAGMPVKLAATSAMNAMAHLMEAVYGHDTNPISYNNSLDGIKKLREGMERIATKDKLSTEANQLLQYGSFLAGKGLCEVSMSLHHKLAHVLGGTFGLDHASVHTVLQAYVLEYQWNALTADVQSDFKKSLDHNYPPTALLQLAKSMKAPASLQEIGFKESDIEKTIDIVLSKPYANPRPLVKEDLIRMLRAAYDGKLLHDQ